MITSARTGVVEATEAFRGVFEIKAMSAEELAGLHRVDAAAFARHLDVAVDQNEELPPARALANQHSA